MIGARGCFSTRADCRSTYQVLESGTSAGANYEEADDGSSARDKLSLRKSGILTEAHDPVIAETSELVKILATLIRKTEAGK